MANQFIGQLMAAGFNFAPKQWALCDGQVIAISSNQALFALLGTVFGGNGINTFGLPDLRGRIPISFSNNYVMGQAAGTPSVTLIMNQVPPHGHNVMASTSSPSVNAPVNDALASSVGMYVSGQTPNTLTNPGSVTNSGGGQPHENRQPYLVINWCIALGGIFPTRS